MKKCRITVMKIAIHQDLIERFENPIKNACNLKEGQVFFLSDATKPDSLCESAWQSLYPFVFALLHGGENFFDGWMKNKAAAMVSCNDGFRPVSFYVEALNENAD